MEINHPIQECDLHLTLAAITLIYCISDCQGENRELVKAERGDSMRI